MSGLEPARPPVGLKAVPGRWPAGGRDGAAGMVAPGWKGGPRSRTGTKRRRSPRTRVAAPAEADESATLTAWLDWHRATVHLECAGLADEHVWSAPVPASPVMTVGGLVSRLRWVEHSWFEAALTGRPDRHPRTPQDPDPAWCGGPEASLRGLLEEYEAQCERSRESTARLSRDTPAPGSRSGAGHHAAVGAGAHDRGDRTPQRTPGRAARTRRRHHRRLRPVRRSRSRRTRLSRRPRRGSGTAPSWSR